MRVETARGTYDAKSLVICSGPWTARILADLKLPLRVTRQVVGFVQPPKPDLFTLDRFPVWAMQAADNAVYYGVPILASADAPPGLKVARHHPGPATDPDAVDRTLLPNDEASFREVIRRHLPDADGPLLSTQVCLYTNTPDSHFILDSHPHHPNVHLACGFSGHGFKFASVVGEIMADLALQRRTAQPIEFLRATRFPHPPHPP